MSLCFDLADALTGFLTGTVYLLDFSEEISKGLALLAHRNGTIFSQLTPHSFPLLRGLVGTEFVYISVLSYFFMCFRFYLPDTFAGHTKLLADLL